jgi:hypothetical protein
MTTNEFIINEIPIKIEAVTPISILSSFNGFDEYVKTVQFDYAFLFRDITLPADIDSEFTIQKVVVKLTTDVTNKLFTDFKPFSDITKEDFYTIGIELANNSQEILDNVKFVRIRTGLDIEPPRPLLRPNTFKPFK